MGYVKLNRAAYIKVYGKKNGALIYDMAQAVGKQRKKK